MSPPAPSAHRHTLRLPSLGASLRHARPALLEGVAGPVAAFYVGLAIDGTRAAIVAALCWSLAVLARRALRRERVPTIVLVGALLLILRSVISWLTGSAFLYFVQPAGGTVLVGLAFLISAVLGRPLTERFANDFCPLGPELRSWPAIRRFFRHIAVLWALVMLADAGIVLWLLVTASLKVFVLERTLASWGCYAFGIAVSTIYFVRVLRRHGIRVTFAARPGDPADLAA